MATGNTCRPEPVDTVRKPDGVMAEYTSLLSNAPFNKATANVHRLLRVGGRENLYSNTNRPSSRGAKSMSAAEIDAYLENLEEPKRSTLRSLRQTILSILPDAEQALSYGVPVFKLHGKNVAGFSAAKKHLSYLPHSGNVTSSLADELAAYETSKGALKFTVDKPLPKTLVKQLIAARRAELE